MSNVVIPFKPVKTPTPSPQVYGEIGNEKSQFSIIPNIFMFNTKLSYKAFFLACEMARDTYRNPRALYTLKDLHKDDEYTRTAWQQLKEQQIIKLDRVIDGDEKYYYAAPRLEID